MLTRRATPADLPMILQLFKLSLGEEGGIPEASFWKWKHELNPFGVSPVLLAFEGDELVGLRTFLCWRFRVEGETFTGYRAVDTATHPKFQGKGIFRKLTLELIEELKQSRNSIIYNTPNSQSMPGYLKMGWKVLGKTRLLVRPFPMNVVANRMNRKYIDSRSTWNDAHAGTLEKLMNEWKNRFSDVVITDFDLNYLRWRYAEVPGFSYQWELTELNDSSCAIFYRVKSSGRLLEARITDIFYSGSNSRKAVNDTLRKIDSKVRPDVITVLDDPKHHLKSELPFGYLDGSSRGLVITFREVNDPALFAKISVAENWFFSSGCLELF